jgi:hypothetical protein
MPRRVSDVYVARERPLLATASRPFPFETLPPNVLSDVCCKAFILADHLHKGLHLREQVAERSGII